MAALAISLQRRGGTLVVPVLAGIASALVLLAFVVLMALYIRGLVWVAFAVCVFVLLPCALFRETRKFSVYGLFISSVIFGAATWILGFLVTLQYWGAIGVFVGVIMGIVGIVPLGMLASAFHSDWSAIGMLALGLVLAFGARMAAFMLAKMMDRDEAGWVVTGVVAGVIVVVAFAGVVALSASNDASQNIQSTRLAAGQGNAVAPQMFDDIVPMPHPNLTPGATLPVTATQVCQPGYAKSVRHVDGKTKARVYREYGISPEAGFYEIDHLISLELGGSNDIRNLWPESYNTTKPWNGEVKDKLEDRLHKLVCDGTISLGEAQQAIARDWIAAYQKYIGQR